LSFNYTSSLFIRCFRLSDSHVHTETCMKFSQLSFVSVYIYIYISNEKPVSQSILINNRYSLSPPLATPFLETLWVQNLQNMKNPSKPAFISSLLIFLFLFSACLPSTIAQEVGNAENTCTCFLSIFPSLILVVSYLRG
jgi:hypothetical protein